MSSMREQIILLIFYSALAFISIVLVVSLGEVYRYITNVGYVIEFKRKLIYIIIPSLSVGIGMVINFRLSRKDG